MRMKIGNFELEGTAEELAEFARQFDPFSAHPPRSTPRESAQVLSADSDEFVSEDAALLMLTRRPLSREQLFVITELYRSGGDWVSAATLQKKLNYSTSKFAGLMGSFGRRLSFTKGVGRYDRFFDQRWDDMRGCNLYRLPHSARKAVERAGLDLVG